MQKTRVRDIEIAYRINGSGEPLILIGGFTMVKESWDLQVAGLEDHFKVLTFDNRGIGETTVPAEPFTIADMAADTAGLMDALGIDSANIFGVSMGGLISQILALDYPGWVKRIALGSTSHGGKHAVQPKKEVMAALATSTDPLISPEEAVRMKVSITFTGKFIRDEPERLDDYIRTCLKHYPAVKGSAGQMKALSFFNVTKRLGEITCPVLVITGSEDQMMPPQNSKLLAEGIPNAELVMIEGAGHNFFYEKPDETNSLLINFFNG